MVGHSYKELESPLLAGSPFSRREPPSSETPTVNLPKRGGLSGHFSGTSKITGQIWLRDKLSASDLESSSLAGYCALIRSNLCTRP
jgi:hypothetical protein